MNAERLNLVARAVQEEIASLDLVGVLGRLRQGLESLANNPADGAAQQTVSEARAQLEASLPGAESNGWPATDRQILEEIGIADVLGTELLERVEAIIARNEITPRVAFDEVAPIHDRLVEVQTELGNLLAGLTFLGVSQDDLVDEYEVGVDIPRGAVDSKLPELGEEFVKLQAILAPFEEVAGEGRPDFLVRSIASSDFGVFLLASPGVVLVIAQAVNVIVDTYEKVLEIKRKRAELLELVPENTLAEVDAHANTIMADRLAALAGEIVDASALVDEGRRNELKIEVKWSLNRLANRIDGGYSIDIRTPPPPDAPTEPAAEGEEGPALMERARIEEIRELSKRIRRLESGDARILELPEGPGAAPVN